MVDTKEIKHIRAAPFALMNSSVSTILAFIGTIILILAFGLVAALIPGMNVLGGFLAVLGLSVIILWPLTVFFIGILYSFVFALIYNLLATKVGGIKLELEGNEVKSIPVVALALISALVSTVFAFIAGLYIGLAGTPIFSLISSIIPLAANATNSTATGGAVGALGALWSVFWIIGYPILTFIVGFIFVALFAIFYNLLAPRIGALQLDFAPVSGNDFELTNIPIIPAALIFGAVYAIMGLIYGILGALAATDAVSAIVAIIVNIIVYFIMYFIGVALFALFYNLLQPKIGGIKLVLE